MYIKKILIILSMFASINSYAATCNIDLVSQNGDDYEYLVNGNEIVVEHSNGFTNLLLAHNKSTNQKYRGEIQKNKVCLNLFDNCVDMYSNEIEEYIKTFLEGNICQGDQK